MNDQELKDILNINENSNLSAVKAQLRAQQECFALLKQQPDQELYHDILEARSLQLEQMHKKYVQAEEPIVSSQTENGLSEEYNTFMTQLSAVVSVGDFHRAIMALQPLVAIDAENRVNEILTEIMEDISEDMV